MKIRLYIIHGDEYSEIVAEDGELSGWDRWMTSQSAYYRGPTRYYDSEHDMARIKKMREEGGPWRKELFKLFKERPFGG